MPILFSVLAAIIPMMLYLILIWRLDKYEPEPLRSVFAHFLWGAFGAVLFAIISSSILSAVFSLILKQNKVSLIESIVIAPFVEEITKGAFLLLTINSKKFDNITDGLVYGGAIGLGFGMTENIFYFAAYGTTPISWLQVVIIRTTFSAVMHCIATASFGAFLGAAKFAKPPLDILLAFIGLILAMLIHFIWNFSVSFEATFFAGLVLMTGIVIAFILVFFYSLNAERKIIINELTNEIPPQFMQAFANNYHNKKGWIDEDIRKHYIKYAVKLAFRKRQLTRIHNASKRKYYEQEVDEMRNYLREFNRNNLEGA